MDFYFCAEPECYWCGESDPYMPIGFDQEIGYVCPLCAFSDSRISIKDLDRIEKSIIGMRNMFLYYQKIKNVPVPARSSKSITVSGIDVGSNPTGDAKNA